MDTHITKEDRELAVQFTPWRGGSSVVHEYEIDNATEKIAAHVAPIRARLAEVTAERDALMRHEYICRKCGLRKDSEPCNTGGHF